MAESFSCFRGDIARTDCGQKEVKEKEGGVHSEQEAGFDHPEEGFDSYIARPGTDTVCVPVADD